MGVLVLKASWQLVRRTPEWDLLAKARKVLEDKDRMEIGRNLAKSLPEYYLHDELDTIISGIDFKTKASIAEGFEENRVWCVLVSERLDMHLYKVEDEHVFRKCFREIFQAHYWVYRMTGILHRDISIFNLMVRKGGDGTMTGVLNDWDLAEDKNIVSSEPHTGTRTGTRSFMSLDLHELDQPSHMLRFDWESFLYFLIWSVFVIPHDDQEKAAVREAEARAERYRYRPTNRRTMLDKWWTRDDDELYSEKLFTLSAHGKDAFLQSPYRFPATLESWVSQIWDLFTDGYEERPRKRRAGQAFDGETLGGHVTYEKLQAILKD